MSTLITGAGPVGARVARHELEAGGRPILYDIAPNPEAMAEVVDLKRCVVVRGDVLNPLELAETIRKEKVERIIHTAANPGLTAGAQLKPHLAVMVNVVGTANVLEAARIFGIERVTVCSSSAIPLMMTGGEDRGDLTKEEAFPRTRGVYATTKQAAEALAINYAEAFGVDCVAVRFPGLFGPWKTPGGGGLLTEMVRGWTEASLAGKEVTLSTMRFEFAYSEDAARGAFLASRAKGLKNRVFNIGAGEFFTPQELAAIVQRVFSGAKVKVDTTVRAAPLPFNVAGPMDLSRAREQLGYTPSYPLEKALAHYKEWYMAHRAATR
ncbi:MAG: NAD(P)-dependent oxidoreductase [Chloroflexi bacterium]|nr:NAD(P)-dependent oxidoreductase [Chloroflexota bacterium]